MRRSDVKVAFWSFVVHWTLSRAVLRCGARRARRALVTGPLVVGLAAALVLSLPLFALVSGRELAPLIAAASSDATLAKVFAVMVVGPALVVGLAVGALVPGDGTLGPQLGAAPLRRLSRFVSLILVPLGVVVAPLTVPGVIGAATASASAPAGRWLAAPIVCAFLATAGFGAALAAAATAAASSLRLVPLVLAVPGTWVAVGAAAGDPIIGIGALPARAASGDVVTALVAAVASMAAGAVAVAFWACATSLERSRPVRGDVRLAARLPHGALSSVAVAVALRLLRQRQVRRHVAIAVLFGLIGSMLMRAVGVGEAGASYFPFAAALVAAAAIPPAAVALRRDADWMLRACPVAVSSLARAGAAASVVAAIATIAFVVVPAAPVAMLDPGAWPLAETSAAMVVAAGVAGGALVPWRPERLVEQTVSYVVVGAIAAIGSYALSRGAAEAAAVGVPEAVFAAITANAAVAGAVVFAGAVER